jgi:RNA polymerase sigma factor (sigma-70 family)
MDGLDKERGKPRSFEEASDLLAIQDTLRGNRNAFAAIVERYTPLLYSLAFRMLGRGEDAEEAVQEILLRVFRTLPRFRLDRRFHPWLYTIALNYLRTGARRQRRAPRRWRTAASFRRRRWSGRTGSGWPRRRWRGCRRCLGLILMAGVLWAQEGFTVRLATALQQMGWSEEAAQLMVRQEAQWQRAEGADPEGVELQVGLDGLAGFFLDWGLEASAGLRWSTANRFISGLGQEEESENNLYTAIRAAADWSPHRAVGLQLEGFLRQEWYLTRAALTEAPYADTGESLRVLCLGMTVRADWTPLCGSPFR